MESPTGPHALSTPLHPADRPAWARLVDANLNRSREGLRTLEDLARFALDDAELSGAFKALRHGVRDAADTLALAAGLDRASLLAWRDTPGDVGVPIKTGAEGSRPGRGAVAAAAAGRAGEALRALEEAAKACASPDAARALESLRYRLYELEKRLGLALAGARAPRWALCVLLSESLCTHHPWQRVAEQAILGGADCLQLREKSLPDGELLDRARALVAIARAASARPAVIINDRPDLALLCGADGVHVGQGDLPAAEVRRLAGGSLLVGVSTANVEQARRAVRDGADYAGVGPMFASSTKAKPALSGVAYLREYLADPMTSRLPHLAISGITPANVGELREAGCRGIAVSGAVCASPDPRAACQALRAALGA